MLRFRLGRVPVQVHPSHPLVAALFGLLLVEGLLREGDPAHWPARVLTAAPSGSPRFLLVGAGLVLLWTAIVSLSVLVHELGHAFASRAFGYEARVELAGLGGHTRPHGPGSSPLPWHRDVLLTLAGPLAGLLLGAAGLLGWAALGERTGPLGFVLQTVGWTNLLWSAVNLVPVMPLDGGRVLYRLAVRAFGRRGLLLSQLLGLSLSASVVAVALLGGQWLLGLFAVLFGLQTLSYLQAYFRGEGPPGTELAGPPPDPALAEAEAHLQAGRLEAAAAAARGVLEGRRAHPASRGRAHLVLGWAALKEGQGRRALEHFSQAGGVRVPPHALAAALSLVGDEGRALPVWEMAWQASRDATVLHEWAGSLLRAGMPERARRLPGVDVASAYACAARVPFLRGAYSEAAALAEQGVAEAPRADLAYEAACAHARGGDVEGALRMLERAAELGYRDAAFAATDEDLARLHAHPGFAAWRARLGDSAVG
jgi:Zn-dependent protease